MWVYVPVDFSRWVFLAVYFFNSFDHIFDFFEAKTAIWVREEYLRRGRSGRRWLRGGKGTLDFLEEGNARKHRQSDHEVLEVDLFLFVFFSGLVKFEAFEKSVEELLVFGAVLVHYLFEVLSGCAGTSLITRPSIELPASLKFFQMLSIFS